VTVVRLVAEGILEPGAERVQAGVGLFAANLAVRVFGEARAGRRGGTFVRYLAFHYSA
jgi:hypothetical protein